MTVEPCRKARRVFVIVDNGSAHRGKASIRRLPGHYKNLILVHPLCRAAGSTKQRSTSRSPSARSCPNDFADLDTLERRLLAFGRRYEQIAQPFEWKFTRADLNKLAQRLDLPAARAA